MTTEAETLRMFGELKGELGEVRGQLRELIHHTNNLRQTLEMVAPATHQITRLIADVAALEVRVTELEAEKHQRTGAVGLGSFLIQSPVIGWLFAGAVMLYGFFTRKI